MKLLYIFLLMCLVHILILQAINISKQDLESMLNIVKEIDPSLQKQIIKTPITFLKEIKPLLEAEKNNLLLQVNKKFPIPEGYKPTDLVYLKDFKELKDIGKKSLKLRKILIEDLINLIKEASKNGFAIKIVSAYRTKEYQKFLFEHNVKTYGLKLAEKQSAMPNHSQHQLGTAIDFVEINDNLLDTKVGKWIYENSSKYGFSLSYPKNYEKETGYKSEPWHYMYIGKQACIIQKKYFNNFQYKFLKFWNEHKIEISDLIQKYTN
ncbi:D-alanyl-D-alanine carboxypeptidase family protein [Borrelia sp. A-FGy1]|uniref:M15 family metallopeptidase n=1 Tax=Borrelia sp. A-FGy1 TaxID=2608247 RepID=UPI0015F569B8|nr:M15 family metallopeptidase [Borrelia sp. A-FGy1]QMU99347.1 D-alanyl-D-alanine carboxypeptidase family protein [Borrelia sp. A-FGy1]